MNDLKYPKVLVVSSVNIYKEDNQTSITLNSFFSTWPKHRISQIICGTFNERDKHRVNDNLFVLTVKDIKLLRLLLNENRVRTSIKDNALPVIPEKSSFRFKLKRSIKMFLIASSDLFSYFIKDNLKEYVNHFNPDVIYTTAENYRIIQIVKRLSIISNVKVIPHFMDDYHSTIYDTLFTQVHRVYMRKIVSELIANSPSCFCISREMCEEYKIRFKKNSFFPLMNCVESYNNEIINISASNKMLRFCYAGGMHLKRDETLLYLIKYLSRIEGLIFEFDLYMNNNEWDIYKNQFSCYKAVSYKGHKKRADLLNIMKYYDVLVFVESFDPSIQGYTKFSISTKIPEYLSLGKNILAIGPLGIASIDYLRNNKAAYIISNINNLTCTLNTINLIIEDVNSNNKKIIESAKKLFINNHLKVNQVNLLINILIQHSNSKLYQSRN